MIRPPERTSPSLHPSLFFSLSSPLGLSLQHLSTLSLPIRVTISHAFSPNCISFSLSHPTESRPTTMPKKGGKKGKGKGKGGSGAAAAKKATDVQNPVTTGQEVEETVTKDEVEPTTATTEAGDAATAAEASTETTAAPAQSVEETPATTVEEVKDKVESLKSTEPVTTGKPSLSKPLDRLGQTLTRARP
ncbi:hypothetical protein BJX96DRAFT_1749 [Aspergillus floccosus]